MTHGEQQIEARIMRCADSIKNALQGSGERNARVIAAALSVVLEHNPDLAASFESLCASFVTKFGVQKLRKG